jgi:hypothetical protein
LKTLYVNWFPFKKKAKNKDKQFQIHIFASFFKDFMIPDAVNLNSEILIDFKAEMLMRYYGKTHTQRTMGYIYICYI